MIGIGDFARLGRVSVRMLRHYDEIGLLHPAHVDPHSSYRYYGAEQLGRLNRIVALKDLGLRLEEVARIVEDQVGTDDLRAILRLRRVELEQQIRTGEHRLARVEARLRLIESEAAMSHPQITTKHVPAATVGGLSAVAASATQDDIGPVVRDLYPETFGRLAAAGVTPVGPSVAYYVPEPGGAEDALRVHATFPVADVPVAGLDTVAIPAAEVASLIHQGAMDGVDEAYQNLHRWVGDHGRVAAGPAREIYLEMPDDPDGWVTEIQLDLAPA